MSGFPLLLIPLAICNIIIFLMDGVSLTAPLFTLPLPSGASWTVTLSDSLLALGLLLLMLEMLRSARVGGKYVTDHLLSLVIFGGAAAEFLMLPKFANATFFLLTLTALVDFLSGLGLRRRPRRPVETVVAEPVRETPVAREATIVREVPPASVIVAPPPSEPAPLPKPDLVSDSPTAEPIQRVEPIIDVPPHDPDPRPVRPAAS